MTFRVTIAALLAAASFVYALFWLANKAILMAYHPAISDTHWMLRFFLPIGVLDLVLPLACILIAYRQPHRYGLWIGLGFALLISAIAIQELTLAEHQIQMDQTGN